MDIPPGRPFDVLVSNFFHCKARLPKQMIIAKTAASPKVISSIDPTNQNVLSLETSIIDIYPCNKLCFERFPKTERVSTVYYKSTEDQASQMHTVIQDEDSERLARD